MFAVMFLNCCSFSNWSLTEPLFFWKYWTYPWVLFFISGSSSSPLPIGNSNPTHRRQAHSIAGIANFGAEDLWRHVKVLLTQCNGPLCHPHHYTTLKISMFILDNLVGPGLEFDQGSGIPSKFSRRDRNLIGDPGFRWSGIDDSSGNRLRPLEVRSLPIPSLTSPFHPHPLWCPSKYVAKSHPASSWRRFLCILLNDHFLPLVKDISRCRRRVRVSGASWGGERGRGSSVTT